MGLQLAWTIPVRGTSLWLTLHPFAIKHCTEVTQPEHLPSQSDNDTGEVTAMEEGTWTSTQTREGFQKIPSNKSPLSSRYARPCAQHQGVKSNKRDKPWDGHREACPCPAPSPVAFLRENQSSFPLTILKTDPWGLQTGSFFIGTWPNSRIHDHVA